MDTIEEVQQFSRDLFNNTLEDANGVKRNRRGELVSLKHIQFE
jgi:hypothetical protein